VCVPADLHVFVHVHFRANRGIRVDKVDQCSLRACVRACMLSTVSE
jgi:hypothetical protein